MRLIQKINWTAIALAGAVLLPAPSFAAIMTFDDRNAFEAAVAGAALTEDPFDNPIPGAEQIALDSGIVSTNAPVSIFPDDNSVVPFNAGGFYRNSVSHDTNLLADTITWDFPMPIIGFGFNLSYASPDGVQVTFDGGNGLESFLLHNVSGDVDLGGFVGFVGFVADTAFEAIAFSNDNVLSTDSFNIDNLVFAKATADPAAVPLPTTVPLTLFGIGGLLLFARRRTSGV
ncbi:hypothetical protein [Pelagibius sp. Alg239-R121]|uniref:hypothetical protein n=1 Tax=Pelagibius sp. Alg239-R121 TaxID=2993448 RepID=UPI0024A64233|nr:hypothetical protein [Pelagibius sp. Alg239-R121]